jgi:hypothetical protein
MTISEIAQETRDLCDADSTSYPDTALLRRINSAMETLVSKIVEVCGFYPYDDDNQGDLSEGTIDLETGVSKYTIADKFLTILEVKVKDNDGYYHIVVPETQSESYSIVETDEASTGLPIKYRMVGRTMFLRPSPVAASVTLTDGLLFKYTRVHTITSDELTAGSLIPGIVSPFHPLIAKMSALPYCKSYKPQRVPQLQQDIFVETNDCVSFYANRLKDRPKRLTIRQESNR